MTAVNKQDSNFTELRYAQETASGVVDNTVTWYPLEPNSYKDFGADVKLKARMPINASRQLKKGVVVDLDAAAGWQQDLTATNFQDLSRFFFWAALRDKSDLNVATVDGSGNAYQPSSGGTEYWANDLLFAKKFSDDLNNGLKVVSGIPIAANIGVTDTAVVSGSTQAGIISRVGYEFNAGEVAIDISTGALPRLKSAASQVAAHTDLVNDTTNAVDGSTVTIGGIIYTIQASLTAGTAGNVHVLRGAAADDTLLNLAHAINNSGGTAGTDYNTTGTGAHPRVTSTTAVVSHTITITAIYAGTQGNSITTVASTSPDSHIDPTGAALASGAGARAFTSFGLIPGEYVFVGGDDTTEQFHASSGVDNGFSRIRSISAAYLEFDKSQATMVADDGTSTGSSGSNTQTIRIFFGRAVKNESDPTLITKESAQFERQLGAPDDSSTDTQAEYMVRGIANKMKLDCKQADIVRMELEFLCNTNELRTAGEGLKDGTRADLEEEDAFNATSDVAFTKICIVTDGDEAPDPLFSYFTDLVINLDNNVKQNKAVKVLGSFDSTAGFFQVSGSLTGYFVTVDEIQAVKDNDSLTIETHFVKFNKGVSIDIPLITASKAMPDVKINEPIMIPLNVDAATAKIIDTNLDHTMLWIFWDYLPDLAG